MISEITSGKSLGITILVVASSLAIPFYIWRKTTSRLPPGPFGLPLLGYLPFLGKELHSDFATLAKRFGPIYTLQLGCRTYIIVNSSDVANVVVHEQDDTFANRTPPLVGLLLTYGGKNITWSDNNLYWRNMRKALVYEVMNNKNMEASLSFREGGVRKTIKHVYESMGTKVCIGDIAFETSLAVTTSLIWGKSLNQNLGGVAFRDVIVKIVDLVGLPSMSDFFPMLARFDLQGVQGKMYEQVQKLDKILEKIIEDRMSVKSQESKDGKMDFLQILLDLRQKNSYTIPQIKALLVDIFLAGTDTSSGMTEWTMAEVLTYPEVMKKIRAELEQVVGLKNIVQESHLSKLRYLDTVIKETFRLHPPLPLLIGRSPSKPCKVGEYIVPKGSTVYMNAWAIHRDPKYWENPLEFNPNRFINPDGTTKFNYNGLNTNFIPFGSGRRRCPGIPVGEKMLMYLLASLIHSFDWTLPNPKEHDLSDKFGIILRKRNPLIAIPSQRLADKSLYM